MMDTGLGEDGGTLKQASHVWAMLDEMANTDPAAYQRFIKKTMEEGKENMDLPKPFACMKTSIITPSKSVLYLNLCSWKKIPKPTSDSDPIAVATGPLEESKDASGKYTVVRLAFNPYVLEESFQNAVDRDLLINLGMDYVENQHKVKLSRSYKECQGLKFKGDISTLTSVKRFFGKREKTEEEVLEENLAGLSPDTLLGKIHELSNQDLEQSDLEDRLKDLAVGSTKDPDVDRKGGLIQEISSTKLELPEPEYSLDLQEGDEKGPRRLELRLELHGVQSVSQCELDISEDEVNLFVEGKYDLHLCFPELISESDAKAKFYKKSSVLLVTLPTQNQR
nr:PIH1 domain-containing protein 2-like [Lytechinus pictus]